jgi:IS30 family transposase
MKRKARNNRIDFIDIDLIHERREQGVSMSTIAEELGVAPSTISNALKRYKVKQFEVDEPNVCYRSETIKSKRGNDG